MQKRSPLAALTILTCSISLSGQHGEENPPADLSVMNRFLGNTCFDEIISKRLHKELITNALEAEPFFINLVEDGPGETMIEKERAHLKGIYEIRTAFDRNKSIKVTYEGPGFEQGAPTLPDEKEYIESKLASFKNRIRARALEGLAILETKSSIRYVEEKANDDNFPLNGLAADLLK